MRSCGDCGHARLFMDDMTKRICRGGPPQLVVLPTTKGAAMQTMFPVVSASDEACGSFKQVLALTKEMSDAPPN